MSAVTHAEREHAPEQAFDAARAPGAAPGARSAAGAGRRS